MHNDSYKPLSRPLFIYAKGSSFQRTEVQAFLDYIFDNEVAIAKRARFVQLTARTAEAGEDQLRPRRQGGNCSEHPSGEFRPRRYCVRPSDFHSNWRFAPGSSRRRVSQRRAMNAAQAIASRAGTRSGPRPGAA